MKRIVRGQAATSAAFQRETTCSQPWRQAGLFLPLLDDWRRKASFLAETKRQRVSVCVCLCVCVCECLCVCCQSVGLCAVPARAHYSTEAVFLGSLVSLFRDLSMENPWMAECHSLYVMFCIASF